MNKEEEEEEENRLFKMNRMETEGKRGNGMAIEYYCNLRVVVQVVVHRAEYGRWRDSRREPWPASTRALSAPPVRRTQTINNKTK